MKKNSFIPIFLFLFLTKDIFAAKTMTEVAEQAEEVSLYHIELVRIFFCKGVSIKRQILQRFYFLVVGNSQEL